jgi:FKBP-type peptidyl-prolyl cis-trans isomerase FkpA
LRKYISYAFLLLFLACWSCKDDFTTLGSKAIQFKLLKSGNGKSKIKTGDIVTLRFIQKSEKDSVIFNIVRQLIIDRPFFNGDIAEGLLEMKLGDSALMKVSADSFYRYLEDSLPVGIKTGSKLSCLVAIHSIITADDYQQQKVGETANQTRMENNMIQNHILKNNLSGYSKLPSGMYIKILKIGKGKNIEKGQMASVNFEGRLLNGKLISTNIDSSLQLNSPYDFVLGKTSVIEGWQEGLPLLNKGAVASYIIPSYLAYGKRTVGIVPANSILIYKIELLNFK